MSPVVFESKSLYHVFKAHTVCWVLHLCGVLQCITSVCCGNVCEADIGRGIAINACRKVVAAAGMHTSAMNVIEVERKRMMWDAPAGLPLTQLFSGHVVNFLSICFRGSIVFKLGGNLTVAKCSKQ